MFNNSSHLLLYQHATAYSSCHWCRRLGVCVFAQLALKHHNWTWNSAPWFKLSSGFCVIEDLPGTSGRKPLLKYTLVHIETRTQPKTQLVFVSACVLAFVCALFYFIISQQLTLQATLQIDWDNEASRSLLEAQNYAKFGNIFNRNSVLWWTGVKELCVTQNEKKGDASFFPNRNKFHAGLIGKSHFTL